MHYWKNKLSLNNLLTSSNWSDSTTMKDEDENKGMIGFKIEPWSQNLKCKCLSVSICSQPKFATVLPPFLGLHYEHQISWQHIDQYRHHSIFLMKELTMVNYQNIKTWFHTNN